MRRERLKAALAVVTMLTVGGCGGGGDDDDEGVAAANSTAAPPDALRTATSGTADYTPLSDVASHAAVGLDAKEIRSLLEPATSGGVVDWAAVRRIFTGGRNSRKDDGLRALAALVPDDPVTTMVTDAIAGTGTAAGTSDAVRRQKVDKGITVILERKVLAELEAAAEKVDGGEVDDATGAPHNVDEAWAFYTAEGQGPASTASKRAADFERTGQVHEAVIAALSAARTAARSGDAAALGAAKADVEAALDYVFYLATFKYLDTEDDPVTRAEGETFYLAIQPEVAKDAPDADRAIAAAFGSGQADAGRSALNAASTRTALGVTEAETVLAMP